MGEVIRNHVMAGTGLPVTLGQMMKECDDLDEEQLQRWHELRSKLEKLGNLKQMRKVDKYLRGLRNVTAHGSTTELDNTSIESLKSWAASECVQSGQTKFGSMLMLYPALLSLVVLCAFLMQP